MPRDLKVLSFYGHRCLQAWAYQGSARAIGEPYGSNLGFSVPAMKNHLLAVSRHAPVFIGSQGPAKNNIDRGTRLKAKWNWE